MKRAAAGYRETPLLYLFTNARRQNWQMGIILVLINCFTLTAFAQTKVSGVVNDMKGVGIEGVTVTEKGNTNAVVTDATGHFTITVKAADATLVFSHTAFQTQEIPLRNRSTVSVLMSETSSKLNEVVVVGYGKQSRDKVTTSITKLDNRTLENVPYANPLSAVQGAVSGVRVQSYSGQPGVAPRIIVRGGTTINNPNGSAPLYVIDGVQRSNMDDIAPDDIESLQILKDAAATSIYGARASNGVVLVTTKSGKEGVARITYSYDLNVADAGNQLRKYVSAEEYIRAQRQAIVWTGVKVAPSTTQSRLTAPSGAGTGNDLTNNTAFTTQYLTPENQHKLNEGWKSMPDPIDPSKTIIYKETDFQDLTYQTAVTHSHYMNVSGGTEKLKYNGSVGYYNGEGIALNSDYDRLTASFNSSLQISKKLRVDGRVMYSNTDYRFITGDPQTQFTTLTNTFYRSPSLPSTAKYQFEDGTMAPGINNSAGNPHYYQIGPFAPVIKNNRQKLTIAIAGRWDILPGLSFEPQVSSYEDENYGRSFQPAFLSAAGVMNTTRTASASYSNSRTYQADAIFSYVKQFGDHYLDAKAGYEYFNRASHGLNASGDGATTDLIPTLNGAVVPRVTNGTESKFVTEGVFGRISYDYKARYLVSVTGRYDGASNLGSLNRFGFFPGIGIGWNLHKEYFWDHVPQQISSFKLRATYGENGNIQNLSDFGWQGLFNVGGRYNNGGVIRPGAMPNIALSWEESQVLDAGFDLGLFNNRLSIVFDYFRKVNQNLITSVVLPSSSGYGSVSTNLGSLENKGFEMELNYQVMPSGSAFQWSVNFNASKVQNKVLKLPYNGVEGNRVGGVNIWDPASKSYVWRPGYSAGNVFGNPASYMEGFPIGDMYAYKQIGIYATDEEAANAPLDMSVPVDAVNPANGRRKYGGDVNFLDVDGNNIIDSRDQVYVGNMFPKWTGGFSNYFTYKGIGLNIRTDFTLGHTIYNYAGVVADGQLQGDLMPTKDYYDRSWKKQGDITDRPRYLYQNSQANTTRNSIYYEKGDFLCIREVTISYTLPAKVLRKAALSNMRVYITGNNLHYFKKYSGPMPEDGGADNGRYPNPRNITFGANISL
jgi:TonB-linked outer membrane protein, SusC/RagA family